VNITLNHNSFLNTKTAFFLQGVPNLLTDHGDGLSPFPGPGMYYCWPQLVVSGTVIVGGNVYSIDSGTGWLGHQMMMCRLTNPIPKGSKSPAIHPIPFLEDPKPYDAWLWQYFNLNSGQSFNAATFIQGNMDYSPNLPYGYFLEPNKQGGWDSIFMMGHLTLSDPQSFPSTCDDPYSPPVVIPTKREYSQLENEIYGKPLSGMAVPWIKDGTFNNPDGSFCAESPADYTDISGMYSNGVGYLETVGFQTVEAYRTYALNYLRKG